MMKSPSDHVVDPSMPDYATQMNNMERRRSWQGQPPMHHPSQIPLSEHDQVPQQRQNFMPEKSDLYGVPALYGGSPAVSQGSNSWPDVVPQSNQMDQTFQPSPANSSNSQYNMESMENSTNAVNSNGISGAAAAAAAAMAAAAHSAKTNSAYQKQPGPAIPPPSNPVPPMHGQPPPPQQQQRMPLPMQQRMPFHPNYANANMGMQPPPHDPAAYQNHSYGGYHHPPPPRQPVMPRHMPAHHYPGPMPQWGPGMQQNNSPDMRMRYPPHGYDGRQHPMERPPYHPHMSMSHPMGPVGNSMMPEDEIKPKVSSSARSSSQKLSALYEPEEPGRKEFIDRVLQYWEEKELPLKHAPLMGRRTLDLFALYQHVKKKGFMQEVTRSKEWAEISNAMSLGNTSATGFTLKKQYCKYLYGFECRFERGESEPQEALARVIEANRKKKQQAEQQQQAKLVEHSPMEDKPMNPPPHPQHIPHPEMQQRQTHPPNQYLPNHLPMDPYSQHRAPGMSRGRIDANNMSNSQMPGMSYGQHVGYGHPQPPPPNSYGHQQQMQMYRGQHPAYHPHQSNNGYMPQPDPGQNLPPHPNSLKHAGPMAPSPRPNFGPPYYRAGPPPPENILPPPELNVAPPLPNAESIPKPTDWTEDSTVLPVIDGSVATSSENVQRVSDELAAATTNQSSAPANPDSATPSVAESLNSTTENFEGTETNAPNTAPSTPVQTSSASSTPHSSATDVTSKDISQPPNDKSIVPKNEPTSSPIQSSVPSNNVQSKPAVEKQNEAQHPPQMSNQFGVTPKSQDMVKQEMNQPIHAPSPVGPYPFASGSPMPQGSPRPFIDNRSKMERPIPPPPPGVYQSQLSYHQQVGTPYRGPMQPMNNYGHKRHSHSMEVYAPPTKMPRPDVGQYPPDGYHGPPVRPPIQGSEMHRFSSFSPNALHRPLHPENHSAGQYGPQPLPLHQPNYPHYPKHIRPPPPQVDAGSPYVNSLSMGPQKAQRHHGTTLGTSDSASKFLQGLVKDYSPSPQHRSSDSSTIQRSSSISSSSSRSHPPSNVSYLLNGQHPYRSHLQGSSTSSQFTHYPAGCVEAIQPTFANFKEKMSQDVGVIEAWQVVMALKSGLLAESTWALNALTVLLHDQNTIRQIVLKQLPGLIHTVIEHYRCSLHELFTRKKRPDDEETTSSHNDKVSTGMRESEYDKNKFNMVSKCEVNCSIPPADGISVKLVPAPSNLQNPFCKLPVKMSIESEDCASLREEEWEEEEEELISKRLHIISSFNGKPVFEYALNEKVFSPNSKNAEYHAAEVTLEDMLSVHSFDRCLSPNKLDDFQDVNEEENIISTETEKSCTTIDNVSKHIDSLKSSVDILKREKTKNVFSASEDKASHIQSCLDRVSWTCDVVLLEDEAVGFPGNSGLLVPYSKAGRYFLSSGGEHIFPKKLKERESELVARTLCLSNLIRGLSCALFNHSDLCTHEDFVKTLSSTLLRCHKHKVRHFKSKKIPIFAEPAITLFAKSDSTYQTDGMKVSPACQDSPEDSDEIVSSEERSTAIRDASDILNQGGRKRVLSIALHDCALSVPGLQDQINGISSDITCLDEDDSSHDDDEHFEVDNKKLRSVKKKLVRAEECATMRDKKLLNTYNEVNGDCTSTKLPQNKIRSVGHEEITQKLLNDTVKLAVSHESEDQNNTTEQLGTTQDDARQSSVENDDEKCKISLSSAVLDSVSDDDDNAFYNHPWWWECVRQVREDSLVTLANLSTSMDFSQFTNENTMHTIIDACLHWSVCSSADAQDPFPSNSLRTILSPQSLSIEILTKLSMKEANVDLILATRPYRRLEKLFKKLTIMVGNRKDQMLREFSIVLLSNFSGEDSAARAIALQSGAISNLLSFLEECEETGLNNQRMFPAGQEMNCGTISYMMQRCALTLLRLARINENRPLFLKHNLRLLSLSMSSLLGHIVLSLLSSVLYELNNEMPNR